MSASLPLAAGAASQAASTGPGTTEQAAPSREQLESSQRAIRDTTKWLVAAAAAVGAVVVAGLQLSHLPTGFWATVAALGGFVIALTGVAVVIFSAAGVLSVGYTTLGELSDLYDAPTDRLEVKLEWDEKKEQLNEK